MNMKNNPLLNWQELPEFDSIKPDLLAQAIDVSIENAKRAIEKSEQTTNLNWHTVSELLDIGTKPLNYAWGIANHFSGVCDSQEWRDEIDAQIEKITAFWSELGQNETLYKHTKQLFELAKKAKQENNQAELEKLGITPARLKILEDSILGFKLGGAELEGQDKQTYLKIQSEKAILCKKISDNVLDANDKFAYVVKAENVSLLDGIPNHILEGLKQADGSYKLTLHSSVYTQIMQYCKNRDIREALYKASITRASDITEFSQGSIEWDNSPLIHRLLELRQKVAKLLGYKNFAEVSLVAKMAKHPQKVIDFITDIAESAKKSAVKNIKLLQDFCESKFNHNLELWDIAYISELLRQEQYNYSAQEAQLYFTLPTVLQGLFNIIQNLFEVKIVQKTAQVWHPDVQFFAILDKNNQETAYFYLDVYTRKGKQSGAWMDGLRNKSKSEITENGLPVAYLICNFNKSADENKPSCITHDDVITLFHECGHGLHHMLTKIEDDGASGINGVEWDAVELPSQFMENFCWDYETVKTLTKHADSSEVLPQELFNKMLKAKNFLNGLFILKQITFSMLDIEAHIQEDIKDINILAKQINDTYHVTKQLDINRWANTFTHVFAGGYAAGYYSYHWAEVLSSDVFSAFEEEKERSGTIINPVIGKKYLQEILQVGGSRPALESFIAFRGREPSIDAFLRHNDL